MTLTFSQYDIGNSMKHFIFALKRYAETDGRSGRAEFWYFHLFFFLLTLVGVVIDAISGLVIAGLPLGPCGVAVLLLLSTPSYAVTVRRLHDIDYSGWWYIIGMIPVVGLLAIVVLASISSAPGDNRFGVHPENLILG